MTNIHSLQNKLKKVQNEIEEYQKNCKHKNQHIKFDSNKNARWFCIRCDKMIRIPSYSELQDWIEK